MDNIILLRMKFFIVKVIKEKKKFNLNFIFEKKSL